MKDTLKMRLGVRCALVVAMVLAVTLLLPVAQASAVSVKAKDFIQFVQQGEKLNIQKGQQNLGQRASILAVPNRSKGPSSVRFQISERSVENWQVTVFSLSGRLLFASKVVQEKNLTWHLQDHLSNRPVASGVFLYVVTMRLQGGQARTEIGKLVVMR